MACAGRICPGARVGPAQLKRCARPRRRFRPWSLRRPRVTIVMGLDQHRAQITAEWLDTETGEVSRKRITPADGDGIRRFAADFRGEELEVALEATTGWRFVVEEFQAGPLGRAGRDGGAARHQEASQERSRRRKASA